MEWKDRIKSRRLDLGLTLEKVAQAVGVSAATISRWERGEISSLNADKVACLANVLQVTPDYLMGWEIPPQEGSSTTFISILPAKRRKTTSIRTTSALPSI